MSLFGRKKGSESDRGGGHGTSAPAPDLDDLRLPEKKPGGTTTRSDSDAPSGRTAPGRQAAPSRMQGDVMARSDNQATGFRPELPKRPVSEIPGMQRPAHDSGSSGNRTGTDPKTLIVGKEISLNGEISSCDRLIVEGQVEASLAGCQSIEIADGGVFKGAAEIHDAEIRGLFEGKLTVEGRLLICATGRVVGEVRYGQIEIECGGEVSGTIDKTAPRAASRPERSAPAPKAVPEAKEQPAPAEAEPEEADRPVSVAAGAE